MQCLVNYCCASSSSSCFTFYFINYLKSHSFVLETVIFKSFLHSFSILLLINFSRAFAGFLILLCHVPALLFVPDLCLKGTIPAAFKLCLDALETTLSDWECLCSLNFSCLWIFFELQRLNGHSLTCAFIVKRERNAEQ